jgi:acetyltransferase
LRILLADEGIDSVIVIFIPPLVTQAEDVAQAIRETAAEVGHDKTLLACFMSVRGAPEALTSSGKTLPSFIFPESAALALAKVSQYAEWRSRPAGAVPDFEVDFETARAVVDSAVAAGEEAVWLRGEDCARLLACYGIRSAPLKFAASAEEAARAAAELGFPVAVKLASRTITHKTDVGGVRLGARSPEDVWTAFESIHAQLGELGRAKEMDGVQIQPMVESGVEAIVGVTQDGVFGPLIMFGLGGVFVELLKDVAFRIQPLTDIDAREMVRSIKGYPMLEGWRGGPAADVAALEELLLRVSALVEDVPEIREMDLNPVKALAPGEGCVVIDSRVLLRRLS